MDLVEGARPDHNQIEPARHTVTAVITATPAVGVRTRLMLGPCHERAHQLTQRVVDAKVAPLVIGKR